MSSCAGPSPARGVLAVLVFVMASSASGAQEPPSAAELIAAAAKESQEFQKYALELALDANIKSPVTEEIIESEVKRIQEITDRLIEEHAGNEDFVNRLRAARESSVPAMREQIIANKQRSLNCVWRTTGPIFGGDRLCEFRVKKTGTASWSTATSLLYRTIDERVSESIFYDASSRTAAVARSPVAAGIPEPVLFGRLPIQFAGSDPKQNYRYSFEEPAGDGESVSAPQRRTVAVWTGTGNMERLVARLGIEQVGSAYMCPVVEYFTENKELSFRAVASEFFELGTGKVPFPGVWQSESVLVQGTVGTHRSDVQFDRSACRILDDDQSVVLQLAVPAGTTIVDSGKESASKGNLTTTCEVLVGIDDLRTLESLPCIGRSAVASKPDSTTEVSSPFRRIIVAANLTAVVLLLTALFLRRRRRKAASVNMTAIALFAGISVGLFQGCGPSVSVNSTIENTSEIAIDPGTIDLGSVAAGTVVPFRFTVVNNSDKRAEDVRLNAGCGCTQVSPGEFVLPPGGLKIVEGKVSTHGRDGNFQSVISASIERAGRPRESAEIALKARVNDQVFSIPSRILTTKSNDSAVVGRCRLYYPSEWVGRVECKLDGMEGLVEITPCEIPGVFDVFFSAHFRDLPVSRVSLQMFVEGQTEPVLRIPVLI